MSVARGRDRRFPTTTLHRFEQFPVEIQCHIWKDASFLPRPVAIGIKNLGGGYERDSLKWFRFTSTSAVPALFSVCRTSRFEAKKYYKRCFVANQHSDFGFQITLIPRFYINPESDIICPLWMCPRNMWTVNQCSEFRENIFNLGIKHLGVDDGAGYKFQRRQRGYPQDLREFTNDNSDLSYRYMREYIGDPDFILELIEDAVIELESITMYTRHRGYDHTKPLDLIPLKEGLLGHKEQIRADIFEYDVSEVLVHNLKGWIAKQAQADLTAKETGSESEPVTWAFRPLRGFPHITVMVPLKIWTMSPEALLDWVPPRIERMVTQHKPEKRRRGTDK